MPPGQFIIFHWWSSQQELHRTWSIQFYERLEEQQVSAFKIHPQGNGFLKKSYPQSLRFQIFKIPGAPNNQTIITTCKCAGSWQSHLRATISVELSPAQQLLSPPALGWTTGKLNLSFWEGDPHPKYPRQEDQPTPTNQLGFKRQGLLKSKLKFLPILQNVYISKEFHLWLGCHKKGLSAFDELVLLVCVNLICKSTTLIIDVLRTCAKKDGSTPNVR